MLTFLDRVRRGVGEGQVLWNECMTAYRNRGTLDLSPGLHGELDRTAEEEGAAEDTVQVTT